MAAEDGLICAWIFDRQGGGREVGWPEIRGWRAEQGLLWVHLDRTGDESQRWLRADGGFDPVIADALLAEEVGRRLAHRCRQGPPNCHGKCRPRRRPVPFFVTFRAEAVLPARGYRLERHLPGNTCRWCRLAYGR